MHTSLNKLNQPYMSEIDEVNFSALSEIAYKNWEEAVQITREKGYDTIYQFVDKKLNIQAYVCTKGHRTYAIFRGTVLATPTNLITDFSLKLKMVHGYDGLPVGQAHIGFYKAAMAILDHQYSNYERLNSTKKELVLLPYKPTLKEFLFERRLQETEVYITGHSLGGAIAKLVAFSLQQKWDKYLSEGNYFEIDKTCIKREHGFTALFPVASPMVGDPQFNSYLHDYFYGREFHLLSDKDQVINCINWLFRCFNCFLPWKDTCGLLKRDSSTHDIGQQHLLDLKSPSWHGRLFGHYKEDYHDAAIKRAGEAHVVLGEGRNRLKVPLVPSSVLEAVKLNR